LCPTLIEPQVRQLERVLMSFTLGEQSLVGDVRTPRGVLVPCRILPGNSCDIEVVSSKTFSHASVAGKIADTMNCCQHRRIVGVVSVATY
jgi:hypothetical protein